MAALLYSLIESAKLAGVEPRAYLGEAARRAIRNPGSVTLPRNFKYPESLKMLTERARQWEDGADLAMYRS